MPGRECEKFSLLIVKVEILRDANVGLSAPGLVFVADSALLPWRDFLRGEHVVIFGAREKIRNEAPLHIRAIWLVRVRIDVDAEGVANTHDADDLIEAILVLVLCEDAP